MTLEQFYKFLVDNDAIEPFLKNVNLDGSMEDMDNRFTEILKDDECILIQAFIWGDTPEGYEYWDSLTKRIDNDNDK